jgi:FkbM family methyltransferase
MARNSVHRRLTRRGFAPTHVAEVGVHRPLNSNIYQYVVEGVRSTLVEPNPDSVAEIREHFAGFDNVTLHPIAICQSEGPVELVRRGPSTHLRDIRQSPAAVNDRYVLDERDICVVPGRTFDMVDDGTIDLLSIDVEGSEWFVLQNLRSRPRVITLETHGARYRNPYIDQIQDWMRSNGYRLLHRNTSDSTYVLDGVIAIRTRDRLEGILTALYLGYRSLAKSIKHAVLDLRQRR